MSTPDHPSTTISALETTTNLSLAQTLPSLNLISSSLSLSSSSQSSTTSQLTIQTLPDTPSYPFQVNQHRLDDFNDTSSTLPTATIHIEDLYISLPNTTSYTFDFNQHSLDDDTSTSSTLPTEVRIYVENLHISPISSITPQYLALVAVLCAALVAVVVWVC